MAVETYEAKIFSSVPELEEVREFWQRAQWHPNSDLDFFTLIVETRAEVISPCVLALLRNGNPVSLLVGRVERARLPFRFGYADLGSIAVSQLVFIDGGLIGEQTAEACSRLSCLIAMLVREDCFDAVRMEPLIVDSSLNQAIEKTFRQARLLLKQSGSKHWRLSLPSSAEDLLSSHSKKHRYWLKRLPRVLDREYKGQWGIRTYTSPSEVGDFIESAEAVARHTYHRQLGVGFHNNEETLRRLTLEAKRGQLLGYTLFIRNEPKAFWYCYTYHNTAYLGSTGYDPDYRRYELGTLLLMKIFEGLCGSWIEVVDFGLGDADYKRRLATDYFVEASRTVFAATPRGILSYTLLNLLGCSTGLARKLLDKRDLAQELKTAWRRRLGTKQG